MDRLKFMLMVRIVIKSIDNINCNFFTLEDIINNIKGNTSISELDVHSVVDYLIKVGSISVKKKNIYFKDYLGVSCENDITDKYDNILYNIILSIEKGADITSILNKFRDNDIIDVLKMIEVYEYCKVNYLDINNKTENTRSVYTYRIGTAKSQVISVFKLSGASSFKDQILYVALQNRVPCIWYLCDIYEDMQDTKIHNFVTGEDIPKLTKEQYLGSYVLVNEQEEHHVFMEM